MNMRRVAFFVIQLVTTLSATRLDNRYFVASTIPGGEKVLAREISVLTDAHSVVESKAKVYFQGTARTGFESIMRLRTSLKVMEKLADAVDVLSKDDLYSFVGSVDWTRIISAENSIKCDSILGTKINHPLSYVMVFIHGQVKFLKI